MAEVCNTNEVVEMLPAFPALPYSGPPPVREHDRVCIAAIVISDQEEKTEDGNGN